MPALADVNADPNVVVTLQTQECLGAHRASRHRQ